MASLLTEVSRVTSIKATAKDASYIYNVDYSTSSDGKSLGNVNVSVQLVDGGYAGSMSLNNSQKNFSFNEAVKVSEMDTMFTSIISEIQAGLATTGKATV